MDSSQFTPLTEGAKSGMVCSSVSALPTGALPVPDSAVSLLYPIAVEDPCGDGSVGYGLGMASISVWRKNA